MIPPFSNDGLLPPGVYPATLAEIQERYGSQSEIRRAQFESIQWMTQTAQRAGIRRIILNGSFATDIMEPNDGDCVLLIGDAPPLDADALAQLESGFPFLEIYLARQLEFDDFVWRFFAQDRDSNRKGMIEVLL